MQLPEWITKEKIKITQLAKEIGIHQNQLYRIVSGKSFPSYQTAKKIQEFTKGEVTVDELMRKEEGVIKCPHCGQVIKNKKELGLNEEKN